MKKIFAICLLLSLPVAGWGTVTTQAINMSFTCTGSTGPYPFTFPISTPTALTVTENGAVVNPANYTIVPVNNNYENGGSVTLNTACPSGQTLVLERMTPLTQTTQFYDNMPAPLTNFMYGLDKLTEIMQEQEAQIDAIPVSLYPGVTSYQTNGLLAQGPITANQLGAYFQVDQFPGADFGAKVQACMNALSARYGGTCDARNFTGNQSMGSNLTISAPNIALLLPCATLAASASLTVSPGVRNTAIHGCAYQGGSAASGTTGGTVWNYTGSGSAFIVGDPSDGSDTGGFVLTDLALTVPSAGAAARAIDLHRVQEADIERVYLIGNNALGQTALTLDGTGNYTGGQFIGLHVASFGTAVTLTGNSTGGANASTFVRLHIDCPTSSGSPVSGGVGVNLAYGDGNTFTGGDWESCDTMLSLGSGATSNTFTGVRNENSNTQINAASGSAYNLWLTGGTMFTGRLIDNGTHNTFWDAFHRQFNNLNGDLWRSQADATVVNHIYTGIGLGNVRGRQDEWQTDVPGSPGSYQNAWLWGPGDGTSGGQQWALLDMLNNVPRWGAGQLTTAGGNNQSFINGAGTGNVCFQCSGNSGTGGVAFGSGGATPSTIAAYDNAGNLYQLGRHDFYSGSTLAWRLNCASTGACAIQSMTPTASAYHLRMYNGAGTEIDGEGSGGISINNTSSSGTGPFTVYGGASYYNTKLFQVQNNGNGTANYLFPSLAAGSGRVCLDVDTSGYFHALTSDCGTSSSSGTVTQVIVTAPSDFVLTGCNITSSGTCTFTWNTSASGSAPQWNQSTTGNAATASALASTPTTCNAGYAPTGVTASGNSTGCAPLGSASWSSGTTYTSASSTQYLGLSSIESGSRTNPWPAPRAGTVQSCTATMNAAESGTNYYTLYLYKNGSLCSSGPAITMNGAQYTAVTDNTHTCSVAQGDLLTWQLNITGTPTTAIVSVSCLY
jgi:hypothetical protein